MGVFAGSDQILGGFATDRRHGHRDDLPQLVEPAQMQASRWSAFTPGTAAAALPAP